ncbi:hypothetical protein [Nocardia bovistercoris]|uniref:Uncharacterized protein n=1 Tax=Nocardia bovistercoris TaxID=2785916 RepID=A0A931N4L6_9NOCA|nr:hypothetical protein [Nocardia bovistercoris]MBH0778837.1 hypothetical protein [Nocardia bovistercoris]
MSRVQNAARILADTKLSRLDINAAAEQVMSRQHGISVHYDYETLEGQKVGLAVTASSTYAFMEWARRLDLRINGHSTALCDALAVGSDYDERDGVWTYHWPGLENVEPPVRLAETEFQRGDIHTVTTRLWHQQHAIEDIYGYETLDGETVALGIQFQRISTLREFIDRVDDRLNGTGELADDLRAGAHIDIHFDAQVVYWPGLQFAEPLDDVE